MSATENSPLQCPACGEAVKAGWRICPACETRLTPLKCGGCGQPIQTQWEHCPECRRRLLCPGCGVRLQSDAATCPRCGVQVGGEHRFSTIDEPVSGMQFVYVPAGRFMMGDGYGDGYENELPVHAVSVSGFYLGRFPVTQRQWRTLMPENPAKFQFDDRLPLEQVTWEQVRAFVALLEQANAGRFTFRLPSEAEWEYAARSGGKAQRYAGGETVDALAWYAENSGGSTQPVGRKQPNGLGLYDMSGNVWEWCADLYRAEAYTMPHAGCGKMDWLSPKERVIRGGSWNLDAWSVRCTRRMGFDVDLMGAGLGLRLVAVPTEDRP